MRCRYQIVIISAVKNILESRIYYFVQHLRWVTMILRLIEAIFHSSLIRFTRVSQPSRAASAESSKFTPSKRQSTLL